MARGQNVLGGRKDSFIEVSIDFKASFEANKLNYESDQLWRYREPTPDEWVNEWIARNWPKNLYFSTVLTCPNSAYCFTRPSPDWMRGAASLGNMDNINPSLFRRVNSMESPRSRTFLKHQLPLFLSSSSSQPTNHQSMAWGTFDRYPECAKQNKGCLASTAPHNGKDRHEL